MVGVVPVATPIEWEYQMSYDKVTAEQRTAGRRVHALCDKYRLQLQFSWDGHSNHIDDSAPYVVVDAGVPLSRTGQAHYVTNPATIEGTLDQLEQLPTD